MKSPFLIAGAAVAFALTFATPAAGQGAPADRKALEEKIRALETKQEETAKSLEALKTSLGTPAPAAAHADLQRQLEAIEKQQAETKATLETIQKEMSQRHPGPIEAPGLTTKSFPLFGSSGQVSSGTSFNPSISVIPDFVYYRDNRQGGAFEIVEEADGFHGVHAEEGHDHGGLNEGFNLGETELAFTASVDPYFDVTALFAASEEGLEAEEVYFQTRRLPGGFQLKGGKFLSGIGYANKQHPHQWDFADQNLAYELLLGGHGLNEKGLQVTWLPKLPFYLQLGAEVLQGENEKMANYVGPEEFPGLTEEADPRVLAHKPGPRLFTGFVKVGPNIGYASALQVGLSYASSRSHQEVHDHDGDGIPEGVLDGTAELWGADLVYKYDSPREYGAGDFIFQAEYLSRKRDLDVLGTTSTAVFKQDGAYFQAVYGLLPRFQVATRYDLAGLTNERVRAGVKTEYETSKRWSAALTFNPSEFSRVRAQYNRGELFVGGEKETFDQFFLQVQFSIGAHGAHKF
ncbi:MAG: porin [Holophagales bacterium]|jgi:hypothetical protein|nr:porin [Holophagales bacterium]